MTRSLVLPITALLVGILLLAGCSPTQARMGVSPPRGRLFTRYKAPMRCRCSTPGGVARPKGLKVGTASATSVAAPNIPGLGGGLGLALRFLSVGWGDVTAEAAARKAGIKEILYSDYELLSVLGVYNRATVFVYGK